MKDYHKILSVFLSEITTFLKKNFRNVFFLFFLCFQITPCNTPATPPNFPDALLAFSKMSAGEKTPSGK